MYLFVQLMNSAATAADNDDDDDDDDGNGGGSGGGDVDDDGDVDSLKTLELFDLFRLTHLSLDAIRQQCTCLRTLNLGQCWKVSVMTQYPLT